MNEEQLKKLLDQRNGYFKIKADVVRIFEPRIFEMAKENTSNVRNTIVVATAMATVALLVFETIESSLLLLSAVFLLVSVITYSFYLKFIVENTIKSNKKLLDENVLLAEKAQEIIEQALDGKINFQQAQTNLAVHLGEVEQKVLRKKHTEEKSQKINREILLAYFSNWVFVTGIILMVVSFMLFLLCK